MKPKWLLKPVDIYSSPYGFIISGEGIIYEYSKREKYQDPQIKFFIVTRDRRTNSLQILFDGRFLNLGMVRRNVEINNDFSPNFKKNLFKYCFEKAAKDQKHIETIEKVSDILAKIKT